MTLYKFPGFYGGCCSYGTFRVLSSCSIVQDVRTLKATNMTAHKRDKCNVLTDHSSFLRSVQKAFTSTSPHFHNLKTICTHIHTHLFGCSVASTFSEEKSNIIFPFEPHFVVSWNHYSAFYKNNCKRGIT